MWNLEVWKQADYDRFKAYLMEIQDLEYRRFHANLIPGVENLIGIRTPVIRNIAKEIAKGDFDGFLFLSNENYGTHSFYEEILMEGLVIGYASEKKKMSLSAVKKYITDFSSKIDNWAVCDIFCSSMKVIKKQQEEFWEFILSFIETREEYKVRMGIVLLMDYYLQENYIDKIFLICDNLHLEAYYVNMAVAWLISIAFINFEDKTREYLLQNQLSKFTYQKSLQKIIESNRVPKAKKEEIRKLKQV